MQSFIYKLVIKVQISNYSFVCWRYRACSNFSHVPRKRNKYQTALSIYSSCLSHKKLVLYAGRCPVCCISIGTCAKESAVARREHYINICELFYPSAPKLALAATRILATCAVITRADQKFGFNALPGLFLSHLHAPLRHQRRLFRSCFVNSLGACWARERQMLSLCSLAEFQCASASILHWCNGSGDAQCHHPLYVCMCVALSVCALHNVALHIYALTPPFTSFSLTHNTQWVQRSPTRGQTHESLVCTATQLGHS